MQLARRSAEQGSAQRGAGTRLRDASVQPIKGASVHCRSHARLGGQIPQGAPLPPLDAPRLRGCDREGAHRHADSMRRARPAPRSHLRLYGAGTAPRSACPWPQPEGTGRSGRISASGTLEISTYSFGSSSLNCIPPRLRRTRAYV
jgi:hypothetical protein